MIKKKKKHHTKKPKNKNNPAIAMGMNFGSNDNAGNDTDLTRSAGILST